MFVVADRHAQAWSLTVRAMVEAQRARHAEALAVLDRTVAVCREIPEQRALAHALGLRCASLRRQDRLDEAERCGADALQILSVLDDLDVYFADGGHEPRQDGR